ncbi:MAG TPA: phospholipase D-like domain-containing protein [Sporichthyaceae bacterium]|jgi:hypothetical protein|nr:phospholipase D-like domain-containing protein [Sporichthyaceae bacterium]
MTGRGRLLRLLPAVAVMLAGCSGSSGHGAPGAPASTVPGPVPATSPAPTHGMSGDTSGGVGFYRLVQYPDAGFSGFGSQTAAATRSIDMEMYELADTTEENGLAAAAARGVSVRVLLDKAFNGGEVNQAAFDYLNSHGVAVGWAPTDMIFHIKATTFDATTSGPRT